VWFVKCSKIFAGNHEFFKHFLWGICFEKGNDLAKKFVVM